ncbi:hypothetical protein [Dyadobacter sp. Leaf189]|uniref:hypothetical protein n=1 Tax=Dyadobacter sp. Leaf189 TaxID=1736295 RepID=UPI0006FAE583|nr:hypothetical protein [Dyadobacter sp. Leaf189]KQS24712.1 hypothetical protein ASG33_23440 [Dyadobacter sp. Leaf189]
MRKLYQLLTLLSISFLNSCEQEFAPTGIEQEPDIPVAIVAVDQSKTASEAGITLKLPQKEVANLQIGLFNSGGEKVSLTSGSSEVTGKFSLRNYNASGLKEGELYKLQLSYTDSRKNQITTSRSFTARAAPAWKRLPHIPVSGGDFTGAALYSPLFSQLAVYRYQDATRWDILKFINGKWESIESKKPIPRHNAIAFPLGQLGDRELIFMGFGYLDDDKLPTKKAYLNDFWWTMSFYYIGQHSGVVFPLYEGIDKDIKYFLTFDKAYLLKENDNGSMWSLDITWDQAQLAPLPEKTGRIAAFTVGGTGYVVNQLPGAIPHLFAYDPAKDKWTRKADFPGKLRSEGTGFVVKNKGYFGLGVDAEGKGLRDIWEYDAAGNTWRYHSDYPGQGSRLLISVSAANKAYLGWGYEVRQLEGSGSKEIIGCTDFWEFNP